jgi:hypothetical protein
MIVSERDAARCCRVPFEHSGRAGEIESASVEVKSGARCLVSTGKKGNNNLELSLE